MKEVLAGEKAFNLTGSWYRMKPWKLSEVSDWDQRNAHYPDWWWNTFPERSFAADAGSLRFVFVLSLFQGVVSPCKEPQKVDMISFRENTEDIYAGIEWQQGTPEAKKFYRFLTEEMGVTKVRFRKPLRLE